MIQADVVRIGISVRNSFNFDWNELGQITIKITEKGGHATAEYSHQMVCSNDLTFSDGVRVPIPSSNKPSSTPNSEE
jgi:hypothetical protein